MGAARMGWPVVATLTGALLIAIFESIVRLYPVPLWHQLYLARGVALVVSLVLASWLMMERYRWTLNQMQSRQTAFFESVSDGIVVADDSGIILYANPAALHMFQRTELVGHPLTLLMPEELVDRHVAAWMRYQATGVGTFLGKRVNLEGRRRNGEHFPLSLNITVSVNGDRQFYGVIRDETDAMKAVTKIVEEVSMEMQKPGTP